MRVPQLVILFGEHVIQTADKFSKITPTEFK